MSTNQTLSIPPDLRDAAEYLCERFNSVSVAGTNYRAWLRQNWTMLHNDPRIINIVATTMIGNAMSKRRKLYTDEVAHKPRPVGKQGVIPTTQTPAGIRAADHMGDLYILLNAPVVYADKKMRECTKVDLIASARRLNAQAKGAGAEARYYTLVAHELRTDKQRVGRRFRTLKQLDELRKLQTRARRDIELDLPDPAMDS